MLDEAIQIVRGLDQRARRDKDRSQANGKVSDRSKGANPPPRLEQVNIRWAREGCRNHLKQDGIYDLRRSPHDLNRVLTISVKEVGIRFLSSDSGLRLGFGLGKGLGLGLGGTFRRRYVVDYDKRYGPRTRTRTPMATVQDSESASGLSSSASSVVPGKEKGAGKGKGREVLVTTPVPAPTAALSNSACQSAAATSLRLGDSGEDDVIPSADASTSAGDDAKNVGKRLSRIFAKGKEGLRSVILD
jgi:hypothetical protein